MSRKITEAASAAFEATRPMRRANTSVAVENGFAVLRLHGNAIAARDLATGKTSFTLAGWNTHTTRERLDAAGVSVGQRKFEPYFYPRNPYPDHGAAFRISACRWYDARTGAEVPVPRIY